MAQNDHDSFSQKDSSAHCDAEEVKESIAKKELQNSILRKLINGIRKPDTPNNKNATTEDLEQ